MYKDNMHPFSESEKYLAEKYHDIVYEFLKANRYSIEEYYHIVIMGYLKGIQKYSRLDVEEDNLTEICWNCMRSEIGNYFKMEKAKKRNAVEIDTDVVLSAEEEVIQRENLDAIIQSLTERQRKIIDLRVFGYSNTEVQFITEMSKSSYYRELKEIKQRIINGKQMCGGKAECLYQNISLQECRLLHQR